MVVEILFVLFMKLFLGFLIHETADSEIIIDPKVILGSFSAVEGRKRLTFLPLPATQGSFRFHLVSANSV